MGPNNPQKALEQMQGDLKIFQERLDRLQQSFGEVTLSPIEPRNKQQIPEFLEIPDSPSKPLESPEVIVNPPERQENPDSSIIHQESSGSPSKPRESSGSPTSTPESIKTKKKSVGSMKAQGSSLSPKYGERQPKMTVKAAQLSRELPVRMVEQKKLYELLSVEHFQSPSEFSIRLKLEVRL